MNVPNIDAIKSERSIIKQILQDYPTFYKHIIDTYNVPEKFTEKLYWFYHNLNDYPVCNECGEKVEFLSFHRGYRSFCSAKCARKNKELRDRTKKTCIQKYGGIGFASKELSQKCINTNINRYGVPNVMQNKDIQDRLKNTNKSKYGVDYIFQDEKMREKAIQTNIQRYGLPHYNTLNQEDTKDKIKQAKLQNLLKKYPFIKDIDGDDIICKCDNKNCTHCQDKIFKISKHLFRSRIQFGGELCTKLNKYNSGNLSKIEQFIKDILDEYNIEYLCKDRSILDKLELDIYIPSKKLAIECNGCFWHNDLHKSNNYHYKKYVECENKGIQLLSIWEDQIINKPDIIRSILLSKLGLFDKKIYARNCIIREIDQNTSNEFLNKYHLQAHVNSSVRIGLYYNDELVSVMTFGKSRKILSESNYFGWELYRFCNKSNIQVIGGASKLFSYFKKKYDPKNIISFSSNDISNGHIYNVLGFSAKKTSIGYWYIDQKNMTRYHRSSFTKKRLINMGYDRSLSESQIMYNMGYWRIYDSGQTQYIWNNNL